MTVKDLDWAKQHLKSAVTYRDYVERWTGSIGDLEEGLQQRIAVTEAEVARELQPGDELWEWDTTSPVGQDSL